MARLKHRGNEVGLREYLLEEAIYLRNLYGHIDGCWEPLAIPVDQLVGRERYGFYRYELPGDHPLRRAGELRDRLVLTEDDQLLSA
ncbi:hypothetical protein BCL50_3151 [Mycolicibacterium litorale]|nr:hypothetical protein BCL50_3151 [Mycolicibacterium litorale]